jgi:tRNA(Ile)-lysidine synthase
MSRKAVNKQAIDQRVLAFIQENRLVSCGQTLLVAVSGGQDSVCLLHVLNNLQSMLGISLHVAHLDHQLRGKDSTADARYVAALAKKLGIPCTVEKRDVLKYQKENGLSLEEAAREVRYGFLAETAKSIGADSAAIGHTLDDQAETILLHLIRGTGTKGLRGLQPVTDWPYPFHKLKIIRPLLDVRREETAAYCARYGLKPRQDATNLSLEPLRNKVRLELLPLLKTYNPKIVESLQRMSQLAGDDITHLENEANLLWQNIAGYKDNTVILDKRTLQKLDVSLQRILLRMAVETAAGTLKDIEARHIEEMVRAVAGPVGRTIDLPYGLVFSSDYLGYYLGKAGAKQSELPILTGEHTIRIPGKTEIPGWLIQTYIIESDKLDVFDNGYTAFFDYNLTGKKLTVRARKRGDRFQPFGMSETKKLGQFMLDAKIPRGLRDQVPVVASPDEIIWVAGYRIDERVKVTEKTKKVLRLEFKRD